MRIRTYVLLGLFSFSAFGKVYAQNNDLAKKEASVEAIENQINAYMKKSRSQKKIAWILLGGGMGLYIVSASVIKDDPMGNNSGIAVISGVSGLATIGSIPLFFAASRNKNKAQLLSFKKGFEMATTDNDRKIYLDDATDYFSGKAKANSTTGIVLTALGGATVIAGLIISGNDESDGFSNAVNDLVISPAYIVMGICFGALSIPFYVRAARLKRTAKMILKTGRFPTMELGYFSPTIRMGRQLSIGIAVQL